MAVGRTVYFRSPEKVQLAVAAWKFTFMVIVDVVDNGYPANYLAPIFQRLIAPSTKTLLASPEISCHEVAFGYVPSEEQKGQFSYPLMLLPRSANVCAGIRDSFMVFSLVGG
jgi:hypothetical protein